MFERSRNSAVNSGKMIGRERKRQPVIQLLKCVSNWVRCTVVLV